VVKPVEGHRRISNFALIDLTVRSASFPSERKTHASLEIFLARSQYSLDVPPDLGRDVPTMRIVVHRGRRQKKTPASGREAEAECSRKTDDRARRRRMGFAFSVARPSHATARFPSLPRDFLRARFIPACFPDLLAVKTAR
jgi:hypothetical protein